MGLNTVLNDIENKASVNIKSEQGDYVLNGLLHCGKCKTPKQAEVEIFGKIKRPMCLCKCEAEKRCEADREFKMQQLEAQIQRNKRLGFAGSDLINCTFANDDKNNKEISTVGLKYVENFEKIGKFLLLRPRKSRNSFDGFRQNMFREEHAYISVLFSDPLLTLSDRRHNSRNTKIPPHEFLQNSDVTFLSIPSLDDGVG